MSLARTPTALGAFYRRLAARTSRAKAITATARKLAVLVYRALSGDLVYQDPGVSAYHQLNRAREFKNLRRRAILLGFDLIDPATANSPQMLFLRSLSSSFPRSLENKRRQARKPVPRSQEKSKY